MKWAVERAIEIGAFLFIVRRELVPLYWPFLPPCELAHFIVKFLQNPPI